MRNAPAKPISGAKDKETLVSFVKEMTGTQSTRRQAGDATRVQRPPWSKSETSARRKWSGQEFRPLIGGDSGQMLAQNQTVDVVRALVGFDRLQIHHVAHDGVVFGDAVGAQNVARQAGGFKSHPDIVALGHRDVLMSDFTGVFQASDV